ncbi:MAG: hypothetical protein COZ18_08715 [Flexibacter sp. CG_4_10_14_3_um_filter_32_15]|nr:MAG: hypothetical protein COZ18_08715 [Flexibacter sp. CG_4_10_14_3_um_filter_32_15]
MKLEDIQKKQPFKMPDEAHFDTISSKIYTQLEKEENQKFDKKTNSVSIDSAKTKRVAFWVKPQFMGIAATLFLLLVTLVGIYKYNSDTNSSTTLATSTNQTQQLDFSKIPTEQINNFLLDEDISENELVSFIPQNSSLESNSIFEQSDLNSIDAESLDLMLEEEYL